MESVSVEPETKILATIRTLIQIVIADIPRAPKDITISPFKIKFRKIEVPALSALDKPIFVIVQIFLKSVHFKPTK